MTTTSFSTGIRNRVEEILCKGHGYDSNVSINSQRAIPAGWFRWLGYPPEDPGKAVNKLDRGVWITFENPLLADEQDGGINPWDVSSPRWVGLTVTVSYLFGEGVKQNPSLLLLRPGTEDSSCAMTPDQRALDDAWLIDRALQWPDLISSISGVPVSAIRRAGPSSNVAYQTGFCTVSHPFRVLVEPDNLNAYQQ